MSFKIGQKVVCIKSGRWSSLHKKERGPVYGQVLTIRTIEALSDGAYLKFDELINPTDTSWSIERGCWSEAIFYGSRFRPLIERGSETGMAILRKVADDAAKRKNLVVTG